MTNVCTASFVDSVVNIERQFYTIHDLHYSWHPNTNIIYFTFRKRDCFRNRDETAAGQPVIGEDGYVEYRKKPEDETYTELGSSNSLGIQVQSEGSKGAVYSEHEDEGKKDGDYTYAYVDLPNRNESVFCAEEKENTENLYVNASVQRK